MNGKSFFKGICTKATVGKILMQLLYRKLACIKELRSISYQVNIDIFPYYYTKIDILIMNTAKKIL